MIGTRTFTSQKRCLVKSSKEKKKPRVGHDTHTLTIYLHWWLLHAVQATNMMSTCVRHFECWNVLMTFHTRVKLQVSTLSVNSCSNIDLLIGVFVGGSCSDLCVLSSTNTRSQNEHTRTCRQQLGSCLIAVHVYTYVPINATKDDRWTRRENAHEWVDMKDRNRINLKKTRNSSITFKVCYETHNHLRYLKHWNMKM